MAITVGTDSYLSVTGADTYWTNRNNSTWSAAATADKEKALREATQYIDGAYNFIGDHPGSLSQKLAWPRNNAVVTSGNLRGVRVTGIPGQIEDATAELALEALSARLRPAEERGGAIKREKVDVIEVEYSDFAPSHKTYDFVGMILKGLIKSDQIKLVRA